MSFTSPNNVAANQESSDHLTAPASKRQHTGPVSRAAATYKRRKTTSACQVCRARRTKCDEQRPCSFCRQTGQECVSSSSDVPHWDPATMRILGRIDELESQLALMSRNISAIRQPDQEHLQNTHQLNANGSLPARRSSWTPVPESLTPQALFVSPFLANRLPVARIGMYLEAHF